MSTNTTQIQYKGLNFFLCQSPTDRTMSNFLKTLKEHKVTKIIRCCEQTYSDKPLKKAGVTVMDFDYPDGDVPSTCLMESLRSLLLLSSTSVNPKEAICIHCKSGLGRGPLLAALALIEKGMSAKDTVELLRSKIRGCINSKQLAFIYNYKPPRKRGSIQLAEISTQRIFSTLSSCFSTR